MLLGRRLTSVVALAESGAQGTEMTSERTEEVYLKKKPRSCPACGNRPVATILYGMPAFSDDLEADLERGVVTIGGCLLSPDAPVWECAHCGLLMYRVPRT